MSTEADIRPQQPMLTISEAAPLLRVPESTLRRLCAQRKIPSLKVGRAWRIKGAYIEDVMSWTPEGSAA